MSKHENRRQEWSSLPDEVKEAVQAQAGSAVDTARTQPGGFTSGVAAILDFTDGTKSFVKALPLSDGMADEYRTEAVIARQLPAALSTPRLQYSFEAAGWIVLSFVALDGMLPNLPWQDDQLSAGISGIDTLADILTPCPVQGVPVIAELMHGEFAVFRRLVDAGRSGPVAIDDLDHRLRAELSVLAVLESTWERSAAGDTLIHFDLRADNMVFTNDGDVSIVDWSSPCTAAPWIDLATFLPTIGRTAEELEAQFLASRVGSAAEPSSVDAFLAALGGMWLERSHNPPVAHVPSLRTHQAGCAAATLEWLRARRTLS